MNKKSYIQICAFFLILGLVLLLITLVSGLKRYPGCYNSLLGISLFLIILNLILLIILCKKPFIKCFEVGIDAYGQRYNEANCFNWFIAHLSNDDLNKIKHRLDELEQWKNNVLSSEISQKKKDIFITKYERYSEKAFYFFIYRSGTRYTQTNYVKTPYKAKTIYWHDYYSVDQVKILFKK